MTNPEKTRFRVTGGYWGGRLETSARVAIYHQWEQLEATGCLDNFRLVAGRLHGFREGLFFSDSDAYKWLDAASRILADHREAKLLRLVDELIDLIEAAQTDDGYLYTYNQLLFPGQRWVNLHLEHEMYCLGHLIEAGVNHASATDDPRLLRVACRSADLLVREFMEATPQQLDGHEEIELALRHLYGATGTASYRELARRFLERRGRTRPFVVSLLPQLIRSARRLASVRKRQRAHAERHPERRRVHLPPLNKPKIPRRTWLRLIAEMASGRYFQQHVPLREQVIPVGHAVRFTYLQTAATMVARLEGDGLLRSSLERSWEHLVNRKMYVTGGIGSLPLIEGFGNDFELDPEVAYAETCAAIGCMLWNREMARMTGEVRYDDLFEWQLYNAASVGMGLDGRSYLYNNPLVCRGGITRMRWYLVPCCPSNISRTWATLGSDIGHVREREIYLSQWIDGEVELGRGRLRIQSDLPWGGRVTLNFDLDCPMPHVLRTRIPSWSRVVRFFVNDQLVEPDEISLPSNLLPSACGYRPGEARVASLSRTWEPGDVVTLEFDMGIRFYRQRSEVARCGGMDAIGRGPLIYCLEDRDNLFDVHEAEILPGSLVPEFDESLLGGIVKIRGRTREGVDATLVPYMLWGNRGASQMSVFVRTIE